MIVHIMLLHRSVAYKLENVKLFFLNQNELAIDKRMFTDRKKGKGS